MRNKKEEEKWGKYQSTWTECDKVSDKIMVSYEW